MTTVTVSWPHKNLNPNRERNIHWAEKAKRVKAAREEAYFAALAQGLRQYGKPPKIVRFFPPDYRLRDKFNMVRSIKAHEDGIADAIDVDDYFFDLKPEFMEPEKPGRVEFIFED